jgi:hypothetical protein
VLGEVEVICGGGGGGEVCDEVGVGVGVVNTTWMGVEVLDGVTVDTMIWGKLEKIRLKIELFVGVERCVGGTVPVEVAIVGEASITICGVTEAIPGNPAVGIEGVNAKVGTGGSGVGWAGK